MNQGIYSLAATMVNQINRVDTLSNNLANANTNGFKQDKVVEGSFNYYLKKTHNNSEYLHKLNDITNTIPKIDGHYVDEELGTFVLTSNRLDFAINSRDYFFKVKNNNGDILLTKDGSFKNLGGFLVTSQGEYVLNQDNEKISIEDGFEEQIALLESKYLNLDKQGDNNYKIKDFKQTTAVLNSETFLIQGSIEKSNINTIASMVGLIDAQRRLEQAQKASTGIDEINQKLIDKLTR